MSTPIPTTLKALVVRSPWCFDIATGKKPIEYRSWPTKHRGPLAICAAKRKDSGVFAGCAIATVELVDCIEVGEKDFEWVLAKPRVIAAVPVAGRLGLFDVTIPLVPAKFTYDGPQAKKRGKPKVAPEMCLDEDIEEIKDDGKAGICAY
jgi:hypothetical protein